MDKNYTQTCLFTLPNARPDIGPASAPCCRLTKSDQKIRASFICVRSQVFFSRLVQSWFVWCLSTWDKTNPEGNWLSQTVARGRLALSCVTSRALSEREWPRDDCRVWSIFLLFVVEKLWSRCALWVLAAAAADQERKLLFSYELETWHCVDMYRS